MVVQKKTSERKHKSNTNYKILMNPCDDKYCLQVLKPDDSFNGALESLFCLCNEKELEVIAIHNELYDCVNKESPTLEEICGVNQRLMTLTGKSIFRQLSPKSNSSINFYGEKGLVQTICKIDIEQNFTDKKFIKHFFDIFYIRDIYSLVYPTKIPYKKYSDWIHNEIDLIYNSEKIYENW